MTAAPDTRDVLLTCPLDCPDACRLKITVKRGGDGRERAMKLTGDAAHPYTKGFACAKTVHYPARQNHPDRPLYPLRRVGSKSDAEARWERVTWDEALDDIAARLRRLLDTRGPQSVLRYHYAGTMGLMEGAHVHALFRALGTPELDETICATAGTEAWAMGYGARYAVDPADVRHARLIVLWGINSLSTHSHLTPHITAARRVGARVVCVDPYRGRTAAFADTHYKIRPGTDAALALALLHQMFSQGWADESYLAEATLGADELRAAGPLTVFAPSDDAFKAVPAKTMEALAADPAQLKAVLSYHVIDGRVTAADIKPGAAKTRQGGSVTLAKAGTFVTVDDAVVQQADVIATNGVAHVVDRVLMPPKK